jgi:hypothetical protein
MTASTRTDDAVVVPPATAAEVGGLRRLYVVRAAFALVWAGLLAATGSDLSPASVTLLVLYPVVDLAAAAYDTRTAGTGRPRRALHLNMALSLVTAIALAVAATSGTPSVLRVWGAWAITAASSSSPSPCSAAPSPANAPSSSAAPSPPSPAPASSPRPAARARSSPASPGTPPWVACSSWCRRSGCTDAARVSTYLKPS